MRESHNNHDEFQLERSLAAFDMFVLHDHEGDIDEVSQPSMHCNLRLHKLKQV